MLTTSKRSKRAKRFLHSILLLATIYEEDENSVNLESNILDANEDL